MRAIRKEKNEKGHIILTCEDEVKNFWGKKKTITTQYIATKEYPKGYWDWRLLPDKTLIGDRMSFQLDSWCKDFD